MFERYKKWRENRRLDRYFERKLTYFDVIEAEIERSLSNKNAQTFITFELVDAFGEKHQRLDGRNSKVTILEFILLAVLLLIAWDIDIGFSLAGISLKKLDDAKEILFALAGTLAFLNTLLSINSEISIRIAKVLANKIAPKEICDLYLLKFENQFRDGFWKYSMPDFRNLDPRFGYVIQLAIFLIYCLVGLFFFVVVYVFCYVSIFIYILENPSWPPNWSAALAWSVIIIWSLSAVIGLSMGLVKMRIRDNQFRNWLRELAKRDPIRLDREIDTLVKRHRK